VWYCVSIISATQEVEVGGLQSNASPDQSVRSYPKNKLKAKRAGVVAQVVK
jgi:hypothetical protein